MAQAPTAYINSPVAGTQYWAPMPSGVIAATGDLVDFNVRAWSGPNGTGSTVTVGNLQVWAWHEYGASMGTFNQNSVVFVHGQHTITSGENGFFTQVSAKFTGGGSVGSFELWMIYTTSGLYVPMNITFSPSTGGPGTLVDLNGNHLEGVSGCWFNADNPPGGGTGTSITPDSETHATTVVPAGAKYGKIQVGNAAGTVLSAASFTPSTFKVDDGSNYQVANRVQADDGSLYQDCKVWVDDGTNWQQIA